MSQYPRIVLADVTVLWDARSSPVFVRHGTVVDIQSATSALAAAGTLFSQGMMILLDSGANAETLKVASGATATNIPLLQASGNGQLPGPCVKPHASGVTVGQLALTPSLSVVGADMVPGPPPWGF